MHQHLPIALIAGVALFFVYITFPFHRAPCPLPPPKVNNACPLGDLPIYFINMDTHVDRLEYMNSILSPPCNAIRIPAVNGTDMDTLLARMEPGTFPDVARLRKKNYFETYALHKALPGQLGNLIAHLDAIKAGFDSGADHIITMEDDVGLHQVPHWPMDLPSYIRHADKAFSGWHSIRLQWNDYPSGLTKIKRRWQEALSKIRPRDYANISAYWGMPDLTAILPGAKLPLLTPWPRGWGNVATVWSRRGMKNLVDLHLTSVNDEGLGIWRCNKAHPCSADLTFWPEGGKHTLITTPPLLSYRLGEVQTKEIRFGQLSSNHRGLHLQSVFNALQWTLEFREYFFPPGGVDAVPFNAKVNVKLDDD